jgi:hypothetical protein
MILDIFVEDHETESALAPSPFTGENEQLRNRLMDSIA